MQRMIPDRPDLSQDGLDGSRPRPLSPNVSPPQPGPQGGLSHRQARGQLALALDPTTEPALLEALLNHVAVCERCRQELATLRSAEAWLMAQPAELPQMAAAQDAVWAALQARIEAAGAQAPDSDSAQAPDVDSTQAPGIEGAASNGHDEHVDHAALIAGNVYLNGHRKPQAALVPVSSRSLRRGTTFTPLKALIAVLAASFLMSSIALLAVHVSGRPPSHGENTEPPPIADILDPGNATLSLGFDPTSRKLFALASTLRAGCDDTRCTAAEASACVWLSSLSADSGAKLWSLLPGCMQPSEGGDATFTGLFMDTALGQVALVDSARQVTTVKQTATNTYPLACCSDTSSETGQTWLDSRDHLLLTATINKQDNALEALAAQHITTGQLAYQVSLDGSALQGAVVSAATGWLYLWTTCPATAGAVDAACVESYKAGSGEHVSTWQVPANTKPLGADPGSALLYVRSEPANGKAETLVLDARTGAQVAQLPPAAAIAFNSPLHHAYLLSDDGVTVVDTRTRRPLSTLPVLAHDSILWTTPAVDERYGRVYLPTIRGKVLTAQDDAAGHLRLSSPMLQATLDAERAMMNNLQAGSGDLNPDDLPLGPSDFDFYYPAEKSMPGGCHSMMVPARTRSAATPLNGGDYAVTISFAWDDTPGHIFQSGDDSSPPQVSYPHQHAWQYHIPAGGGAAWTGEHGEALPTC